MWSCRLWQIFFNLRIIGSCERGLEGEVISNLHFKWISLLQYENRLYQGDYLGGYYSISGESLGIES